jgi:FkbM family methyltransferase
MQFCLWDDLPHLLNELTHKINNDEKVVMPLSLLALLDDPALHRKTTGIYVNEKCPQNHVLPKIDRYPRHAKIKIGYFSADFRDHPVAMLTAELYETHDRNQFEIYAFSFGRDTKDDMNLRIKAGVDHFHDVRTLSDNDIALLARTFEIDIAVDLGGHTADARMRIFAMQVAPIQISYIGYLGTLAANYYDYLVADQTLIPEKYQQHYSEKIAYLPHYQVNDSKKVLPTTVFSRQVLELPETGFVFCCFNNTFKITPTTFDSWTRILKQVDGSVLLIYADNDSAQSNLTKEIVLRGIEPTRLIFGKRLPLLEYLARYRVADLFLDTLPYNAGTTASDALRMGLPVLTCMGQSFASRVAASLLMAVNLPELITTTQEHYEALAIELATQPQKLKTIKAKLVANLATAPLYDTPLFTKHLESAYLTMYDRYQKGLAPEHIVVEHYHNKAIAVHESFCHLQNTEKPMPIVDQEMQRMHAQSAVEQTTRIAYIKALSEAGNMKINTVIIEHDDRELLFNFREDSIADNGVIKQIFQDNDYHIAHWEQGKKLIEYHNQQSKIRPSLIIDAGANIGASAVYFSINYPNSLVFSLEPDTTNWHLLEINTIGLNVFNFNGAIADVDGELTLVDPGRSDWRFMTTAISAENEQGIKKVKSISPLSILSHPATQNLNPLILKIDIEGGEDALFKGDTYWLKKFPLIIIELHDWMLPFSGSSRNFIKAIAEHDFDFVHRGENIFLFNRQILGG